MIDVTMIHTSELTDFTPGSIIRSLYDAFAEEINSFYMLTQENILGGIANGVTQAFGFDRREAIASHGTITVTFYNVTSREYQISQGTTFFSSIAGYNQTYYVPAPVSITANALTADLPVYCTVAGSIGNIPAGLINSTKSSISNIKSITNRKAFNTGQDQESLADLRSRFRRFILAIGRATVKAIDYGTRTVEGITGVYVYEVPGMITVYAHDADGNLSAEQAKLIQTTLEGDGSNNQGLFDDYKPAGVPLRVLPIEKYNVDLVVRVMVDNLANNSVNLENTISARIQDTINKLNAGQDLTISSLVRIVMDIDSNIIRDVVITRPITDEQDDEQTKLNTDIENATVDLQNANNLVVVAQGNVTTNLPTYLNIGSDYVLTPSEKKTLSNLLLSIKSTYVDDQTLANKYQVSYSKYANAYNQLVAYLNGTLGDLSLETEIDYTDYSTAMAGYFDSRVVFGYDIQKSANSNLVNLQNQKVKLDQELYEYQRSNINAKPSQLLRSGVLIMDMNDETSYIPDNELLRETK